MMERGKSITLPPSLRHFSIPLPYAAVQCRYSMSCPDTATLHPYCIPSLYTVTLSRYSILYTVAPSDCSIPLLCTASPLHFPLPFSIAPHRYFLSRFCKLMQLVLSIRLYHFLYTATLYAHSILLLYTVA